MSSFDTINYYFKNGVKKWDNIAYPQTCNVGFQNERLEEGLSFYIFSCKGKKISKIIYVCLFLIFLATCGENIDLFGKLSFFQTRNKIKSW